MLKPSQTKLDAGFRVDVTVTLPDGAIHRASRVMDEQDMTLVRQGAPESGASMMLELLGQQAVEDIREQLAPGLPPSERL